ncbi:MAG: type II toxin-antitoxin system prevent-host-death family antitoxin [Candidatus Dadabacteria bacterium]|nr:type II toxin-antitoxin system prevent-host-death family antitoxin [Candidatus Dadabacteria bacterium]NIS10191.1 type II toxin-antitoxin system prevent-host-death family antitoxin [Candidatus Dadabacteria bacterium]NIV42626.1 type II toxin-antitoxin system prevent-host-death family antitoxin [Candidatus Dadabacteria bacterium]NIX16557.1 type II toxin-antitoxin system prevent-host-death family antitoxin [Candidatus Dadabacteria bacterium]NIY23106.1 type II toxin-antitoxin system prevent-host-
MSIKEARKQIGNLLDRAKKGEEVILTRRGVPEGKIIAFKNNDSGNKGLPDLSDLHESIKISEKSLSELVVEEREERY